MIDKSRENTYAGRAYGDYGVDSIAFHYAAHNICHKSYSSANDRSEEYACHLYRESAEAYADTVTDVDSTEFAENDTHCSQQSCNDKHLCAAEKPDIALYCCSSVV